MGVAGLWTRKCTAGILQDHGEEAERAESSELLSVGLQKPIQGVPICLHELGCA